MSIFATALDFDADDHDPQCARWVECDCDYEGLHGRVSIAPGFGHWRYDDGEPCTCFCGPIKYQGSHVFPSDDDPRGGQFHVAYIPGYIRRDGRDVVDDDGVWPWLRVSVNGETVILGREQVRAVYADLHEWLEAAK